ncbi:MAG: hypothetical protein KJO42_15835 [Silicimonas sp.]|nr:hypothetical protein [Silicimonas sp.]NNF91738.1 hypothetical protein [Boseongicola sp.]RZW12695.1 MAG: hypothetical protein EX266_00380 [Paracoccaceae bacterium]MBT8425805.1 hypothetical protein [Silicimonas sp.]NND17751.1 hypothetical protein [Silicimonas sp.]
MVEHVDLILVLGVVILALAFPSMVGAFSRGAPPRAAMLAIFAGGVMIMYANSTRPGGYSVAEMPQVFLKVITGA